MPFRIKGYSQDCQWYGCNSGCPDVKLSLPCVEAAVGHVQAQSCCCRQRPLAASRSSIPSCMQWRLICAS